MVVAEAPAHVVHSPFIVMAEGGGHQRGFPPGSGAAALAQPLGAMRPIFFPLVGIWGRGSVMLNARGREGRT